MFFQGLTVVVGATDKKEKFGYKIFKQLLEKGVELKGMHPKLKELEGKQVVQSLEEIKENIDTFVLIIAPEKSKPIIQEALAKGVKKFWFQPGAESEELQKMLFSYSDTEVSTGSCILHI